MNKHHHQLIVDYVNSASQLQEGCETRSSFSAFTSASELLLINCVKSKSPQSSFSALYLDGVYLISQYSYSTDIFSVRLFCYQEVVGSIHRSAG